MSRVAAHRVAMVRKGDRTLEAGLVWVEVYLPFDVEAFKAFEAQRVRLGSAVAVAKAFPDLAIKALTPIDSQVEAMLPDDLLVLAHEWLCQSRKMDVAHDEQARATVRCVESFLNGPEVASPHFWPGAWVQVFEVSKESAEWAAVEKGELNAVSFQAYVKKSRITLAV